MSGGGKHIVLVHGPGHGAWSWYQVKPLLEAEGHTVSAIDLAASGLSPLQWCNLKSISDYFEPLFSFLEALLEGQKVVLVGHSRGGIPIGAAMERFPKKIAVGVYVTATLLGPNFSITDLVTAFPANPAFYQDSVITYDDKHRFTSILFGPQYLKDKLYTQTPSAEYNLGILLVRPYPFFDDERSAAELALTEKNFGSVKKVYVKSELDVTAAPALLELLLSKTPVDEVYEVLGSDHMVMLSQPKSLASVLDQIANKC